MYQSIIALASAAEHAWTFVNYQHATDAVFCIFYFVAALLNWRATNVKTGTVESDQHEQN